VLDYIFLETRKFRQEIYFLFHLLIYFFVDGLGKVRESKKNAM
jgi:hypothetical protein